MKKLRLLNGLIFGILSLNDIGFAHQQTNPSIYKAVENKGNPVAFNPNLELYNNKTPFVDYEYFTKITGETADLHNKEYEFFRDNDGTTGEELEHTVKNTKKSGRNTKETKLDDDLKNVYRKKMQVIRCAKIDYSKIEDADMDTVAKNAVKARITAYLRMQMATFINAHPNSWINKKDENGELRWKDSIENLAILATDVILNDGQQCQINEDYYHNAGVRNALGVQLVLRQLFALIQENYSKCYAKIRDKFKTTNRHIVGEQDIPEKEGGGDSFLNLYYLNKWLWLDEESDEKYFALDNSLDEKTLTNAYEHAECNSVIASPLVYCCYLGCLQEYENKIGSDERELEDLLKIKKSLNTKQKNRLKELKKAKPNFSKKRKFVGDMKKWIAEYKNSNLIYEFVRKMQKMLTIWENVGTESEKTKKDFENGKNSGSAMKNLATHLNNENTSTIKKLGNGKRYKEDEETGNSNDYQRFKFENKDKKNETFCKDLLGTIVMEKLNNFINQESADEFGASTVIKILSELKESVARAKENTEKRSNRRKEKNKELKKEKENEAKEKKENEPNGKKENETNEEKENELNNDYTEICEYFNWLDENKNNDKILFHEVSEALKLINQEEADKSKSFAKKIVSGSFNKEDNKDTNNDFDDFREELKIEVKKAYMNLCHDVLIYLHDTGFLDTNNADYDENNVFKVAYEMANPKKEVKNNDYGATCEGESIPVVFEEEQQNATCGGGNAAEHGTYDSAEKSDGGDEQSLCMQNKNEKQKFKKDENKIVIKKQNDLLKTFKEFREYESHNPRVTGRNTAMTPGIFRKTAVMFCNMNSEDSKLRYDTIENNTKVDLVFNSEQIYKKYNDENDIIITTSNELGVNVNELQKLIVLLVSNSKIKNDESIKEIVPSLLDKIGKMSNQLGDIKNARSYQNQLVKQMNLSSNLTKELFARLVNRTIDLLTPLIRKFSNFQNTEELCENIIAYLTLASDNDIRNDFNQRVKNIEKLTNKHNMLLDQQQSLKLLGISADDDISKITEGQVKNNYEKIKVEYDTFVLYGDYGKNVRNDNYSEEDRRELLKKYEDLIATEQKVKNDEEQLAKVYKENIRKEKQEMEDKTKELEAKNKALKEYKSSIEREGDENKTEVNKLTNQVKQLKIEIENLKTEVKNKNDRIQLLEQIGGGQKPIDVIEPEKIQDEQNEKAALGVPPPPPPPPPIPTMYVENANVQIAQHGNTDKAKDVNFGSKKGPVQYKSMEEQLAEARKNIKKTGEVRVKHTEANVAQDNRTFLQNALSAAIKNRRANLKLHEGEETDSDDDDWD